MGMAADSKSEEVMKYAYQICDAIVRKHLGVIEEMFIPAISGVGKCFRHFARAAFKLKVGHVSESCTVAIFR